MSCLPAVERYLDRHTAGLELPAPLVDAIRYSLLGGGKRLRPVLVCLSSEAVGGRLEAALPAAAAVELIHAFSLVHDDLPAMDDDDLRRGKPTLHIHSGEAMAILAGDAMMALAFELLVEEITDPALSSRLVRELSVATTGMIAGQVYDTIGGIPDSIGARDRVDLIHRNKTGALIRCACRMGAIIGTGSADDPGVRDLSRFGEHIGLVFQIVDDLIDVESSPEQTGKRTRKDADAGKTTYPVVLGLQASRREVNRLTDLAIADLSSLGNPAEPLRELARFMASRTH
jgi:geranylgeranyl diphosphate synthase, type II